MTCKEHIILKMEILRLFIGLNLLVLRGCHQNFVSNIKRI